jgi:N-acetylmuramoyl-L-alanine amidase
MYGVIQMKQWRKFYLPMILVAAFVFSCAVQLTRTVSAGAAEESQDTPVTIIIDAGHGGEDGGASTADGVPESKINLEIALRLNDLLHLLGHDTVMVRTSDISIYSAGAETIAQKKVSDLKNRVALIEQTENALLVSIHQNTFSDSKYAGAQVFYAPTEGSSQLAELTQSIFGAQVDTNNHRKAKKISQSVYLMNHISCTGILAECGFLSNDDEAVRLQTRDYQIKLAAALSGAIQQYLGGLQTNEV